MFLGAAEGCGGSLQESCLQGFDTLGLHQVFYPVSSKVEHSTDNRATEDRYLYRVPSFISVWRNLVASVIWGHVVEVQILVRRPVLGYLQQNTTYVV